VNLTHLYPPLFQGPTFQLLTRIEAIGPRGLKAHAQLPKSSLISKFSSNRIPELEAAAHAAGVWSLIIHDAATLYHGITRVKYARTDATPVNEFELEVKKARFDGKVLDCDVDVEDVNGNPFLQVAGLQLISTDMNGKGFHDVIPFAHEKMISNGYTILRVPIQWVSDALADPAVFDELLSLEEKNAFSGLSEAPLKRRAEWMAGTLAAKAALRSKSNNLPVQQAWNTLEIRRDTKTGIPPTVDGDTQVTITHAGKWAAAVAYDSTLEQAGVDVEVVQERPTAFLEEAFSDRERSSLRNPQDVTRAWCIKEAVLKSLRVGLNADLHQVIVNLSTTPPKVELTAELATVAGTGNIIIHEISFDDLHIGVIAIVRK
jgi:phosphopantetheinyl transferase